MLISVIGPERALGEAVGLLLVEQAANRAANMIKKKDDLTTDEHRWTRIGIVTEK